MVTRQEAEDFAASQFQESSEAWKEFREHAQEAKEEARSFLDEPFHPAAEFARGYGDHFRQVARTVEPEDAMIGACAEQVAVLLDKVSQELDRSSPRELYGKASAFAEERPVEFALGAAAAGFVLMRFLNSRPPRA
ncbi:hypothetical protein [Tepidicaulis sp.]|uniref:hypothetical protein n=1 Tax=Tepidicaulis sp. TaxID=1920809 RepID=UPI003B590B2B